jgi:uncharacterized protein (UPF0303 family)
MADYQQLLEELQRQEQELQFRELTNDTAPALGQRFIAVALRENDGAFQIFP